MGGCGWVGGWVSVRVCVSGSALRAPGPAGGCDKLRGGGGERRLARSLRNSWPGLCICNMSYIYYAKLGRPAGGQGAGAPVVATPRRRRRVRKRARARAHTHTHTHTHTHGQALELKAELELGKASGPCRPCRPCRPSVYTGPCDSGRSLRSRAPPSAFYLTAPHFSTIDRPPFFHLI